MNKFAATIRVSLGAQLALAAALAWTSASADAAVVMMVDNTTITDNGAGDLTPSTGSINVIGGSSLFAIAINAGVANSGLFLSSVLGTSAGPGTYVIKLTETDLTGPVSSWATNFSGNFSGGSASLLLQSYVDPSNTAFGTSIALASLFDPFTPFALSGTNVGASGTLYSITEVLTLTIDNAGRNFSLEADLTPVTSLDASVPEPGNVALIGVGIAGMAAARRRRNA